MASEYEKDTGTFFHLYSVDEYIDLVIDYIEHLRPDLVLERFRLAIAERVADCS